MVVIFDACLFYPIAIRHFATHLAAIDDFQARWTRRIDEEWMSNVSADLGIARERLLPTLEWFALAVPDYLIEDCEGSLPDCCLRHNTYMTSKRARGVRVPAQHTRRRCRAD